MCSAHILVASPCAGRKQWYIPHFWTRQTVSTWGNPLQATTCNDGLFQSYLSVNKSVLRIVSPVSRVGKVKYLHYSCFHDKSTISASFSLDCEAAKYMSTCALSFHSQSTPDLPWLIYTAWEYWDGRFLEMELWVSIDRVIIYDHIQNGARKRHQDPNSSLRLEK